MSATLSTAPQGIRARIKALAARPENLTVRELVERYMACYTGRDTALTYRLDVWRTLLGDFALETIDRDVMHAARDELATLPALSFKGRDAEGERIFRAKSRHGAKSPATINRYMAAISAVFTWAIEQRLTPRAWSNPCRGLRRMRESQGRVRFLDAAERDRLFEACRASRYPRLYALVLTAMLTGGRFSELMGLRWRDVDLDAGTAFLDRSKNGDRGTLVLLPQVVDVLRPLEGARERFVFGSVASGYQRPASIDTAWRKALARARVADFRFHDLRHCCASYLAQAGVPLQTIKEVLRHRKIDMTLRYAHLTTQAKAAAMRDALREVL